MFSIAESATDEELKDITATLFQLIDSPPVSDLSLHFQGETHSGSNADQAPNKYELYLYAFII